MAQLEGVFAVSCTPFDAAGEVDERVLRRHVLWMLDEGVDGVIPTGSTGEFAFLSEDERRRVLAVTLEAAGGRVPVYAGAAACATRETVRHARHAEQAGADGVMIVSPYYGHLSQDELYHHFRAVSESIAIPVILYNNPGTTGSDVLAETVARLAELRNIVAVKESTGEMQRVNEIINGKRGITPSTALRLARFFGMSADFWMNLQSAYELDLARREMARAGC